MHFATRSDGVLIKVNDDGRRCVPISKHRYRSVSSPGKFYTTILWEDGRASCNCRGWATHKHCRHSDEIEATDWARTVRGERTSIDREYYVPSRSGRRPAPRPVPPPAEPVMKIEERDLPKPYRRIRLDN